MTVDADTIRSFLERYGAALSAGDLDGVADCWALPALVVSDDGAVEVTDTEQIRTFFGQAVAWYRSRGIVATRPQIERTEPLSDRLVSVDARWPTFDADGSEVSSERSRYVLRVVDDGSLGIHAAITRATG